MRRRASASPAVYAMGSRRLRALDATASTPSPWSQVGAGMKWIEASGLGPSTVRLGRNASPSGFTVSERLPVEVTMATYRIVCTVKEPPGHSNQEEHIVAVGVGDDANTAVQKLSLDEVLVAMDLADIFYTKGTTSDTVALVQKYTCTRCGRVHIRSATDAVTDNNLDSLPRCS
jgi:hypothetical protein